jgi:hypothetical protein
MRDEEVELDRVFVLLFDASLNEEEAVGRPPGLGLVVRKGGGKSAFGLTGWV